MAEAKTAIKGRRIHPGSDVKPRYLQGSMYTTRAVRMSKRSAGGAKKLGKKKIQVLKSPFSVGCDSKGWYTPETT